MSEPEEARADIRERIIHAPPDVLFAAFKDPLKLAKWWGPKGFSNTFEEFDFQPGGSWRFTMHGPDGKTYQNDSTFLSITTNRQVIVEHHSGHHFVLTITFEPVEQGTLVCWRQVFDTSSHYNQIADMVAQANEQNLVRLENEVGAAPHV